MCSTGLFTPGADLQPGYFTGSMFQSRVCVFGLLLLLFANLLLIFNENRGIRRVR